MTYDDAFMDGYYSAMEDMDDDYSYEGYYDDEYDDYDGLYDLDSFDDGYAEESLKDFFDWKKERKMDKKNARYYLKKYTSIARSLEKELRAKCADALKSATSKAEKIKIKRDFDIKIKKVWEKCADLKSKIPEKIRPLEGKVQKTMY